MSRLPNELQVYVLNDNHKLQVEIQQWDASKALIAQGDVKGAKLAAAAEISAQTTSQTAPDIVSSVMDLGEHMRRVISILS